MNWRRSGGLFAAGMLALVSTACVSKGFDPASAAVLVPAGQPLYVRLQSSTDRDLWQTAARQLGLGPDIAGRVQDICIMETRDAGHGTLILGDFPRGLTALALESQGWTRDAKERVWPVWLAPAGANQSLAILEERTLLLADRQGLVLDWYAAWQASGAQAALPALFQASSRPALLQISSDLSALSSSFRRLEIGIFRQGAGWVLMGSLSFGDDVPERQVRPVARVVLMQFFQIMGLDPAKLSAVRLQADEATVSLDDLPLSRDEVATVLATMARGQGLRQLGGNEHGNDR